MKLAVKHLKVHWVAVRNYQRKRISINAGLWRLFTWKLSHQKSLVVNIVQGSQVSLVKSSVCWRVWGRLFSISFLKRVIFLKMCSDLYLCLTFFFLLQPKTKACVSPSRADLEWWHTFLLQWNEVSLLLEGDMANPQLHVVHDSSWGAGAFWEKEWFQILWSKYPEFKEAPISAKDLLPIVIAVALWCSRWQGKIVCCDITTTLLLQRGSSDVKTG